MSVELSAFNCVLRVCTWALNPEIDLRTWVYGCVRLNAAWNQHAKLAADLSVQSTNHTFSAHLQ